MMHPKPVIIGCIISNLMLEIKKKRMSIYKTIIDKINKPINVNSTIPDKMRDFFSRLSFSIILLWVALPSIMVIENVCSYLFIYDKNIDDRFLQCQTLYRTTFYLLGVITVIYALLCIAVILFYRKETLPSLKKNNSIVFLSVLLIWSILCTACSGHFFEELTGTFYRNEGLCSYFIYASIFVSVVMIEGTQRRNILIKIFAYLATVISVIIVLQNNNVGVIPEVFPGENSGVFFQINHCGYYLAMTILCLFGFYMNSENTKERVKNLILITIQFYSLCINDTFGCFLAVLITIPVVYWFYSKRRKNRIEDYLPIAVIVGVSILADPSPLGEFTTLINDILAISKDAGSKEADSAGTGRWILWRYAIYKIKERPLLGYGPEGLYYNTTDTVINIVKNNVTGEHLVDNTFSLASIISTDRPHNEYIQYAAFLGIPGLCLYLASVVSLAIKRIKCIPELNDATLIAIGAMVAYLVSAFVGNTMFYTTPYFFMFFAMVAVNEPIFMKYDAS